MIETKVFYDYLITKGITSFYGVPDSLLKDICAYITESTPKENHIITANEGNAVALASGYYLATGKPAMVYLQNSGLGNTINPLLSLADEDVYNIPILFMVGWRGEPGIKDEPQHVKQGKLTLPLLDTLGIKTFVLENDFKKIINDATEYMEETKKSAALIVRKNTFSKCALSLASNNYAMSRENALKIILSLTTSEDVVVSTTGKTSRELFEIREQSSQGHNQDFLTVGSMGHTSSIALGIALNTKKIVYCIDGDGSMLMHLGALAIATQNAPDNFKYIVINNGSHESVGGQPTVGFEINTKETLKGLGFNDVFEVKNEKELSQKMAEFKKSNNSALIVFVKQGSRDDLGRPTLTPKENKEDLMKFLESARK